MGIFLCIRNLKSLGMLKNRRVRHVAVTWNGLWNPSDWFESQLYSRYKLCDFCYLTSLSTRFLISKTRLIVVFTLQGYCEASMR